jgi:[ribosomal protein S5]-alanine N-acetyltransferase
LKPDTLETARLQLEPFAEQHLTERYVGWLGDPEVVRYSEQRFRTHTLESCRAYWQSFDGTPNLLYAIVAKDSHLGHVGNLNVYIDERHGTADIGILLGERSVWGRGFGREAWAAVLHHLLADPRLRKVTGGCAAENTAMVRIMRGCGMTEDGRRSRQYVYDDKETDIVYFGTFSRPRGSQ